MVSDSLEHFLRATKVRLSDFTDEYKFHYQFLFDNAPKARIIRFSRDQANALPPLREEEEIKQVANLIKLPFDLCYMDLSHPHNIPFTTTMPFELTDASEVEITFDILGALLNNTDNGFEIRVLSHLHFDYREVNAYWLSLLRLQDGILTSQWLHDDSEATFEYLNLLLGGVVINNLSFLLSANVSLEEANLPRQQKRQLKRSNKPIPLDIKIKAPKHSASESSNSRDYRYRFEVRGHFKHYSENTRVAQANPDKILNIPGKGRCVKVWCPPFVKGSSDKPLVIKSRYV